jgi:hypothetical protein
MSERLEWDYPPTMRGRNRRLAQGQDRVLPMEGEILTPQSEPQSRIRVDVHHHFRRPVRLPVWAIALLAFGVLAMLFPFGLVVSLVIVAILALMYPAQAFIFVACLVTAAIIIALDRRRRRVAVRSNKPAV